MRLLLQLDRVLVHLAALLVVRLRVLEQQVQVGHHLVDAVVLLALVVALDAVEGDRVLDDGVVVLLEPLVRQSLEREDTQLAVLVLEPPQALEDRVDAPLERRKDLWRPSAFLSRSGVVVVEVFFTCRPPTAPPAATARALVVRVVVLLLFVFLLLLVFVVLRRRRVLHLRDLAQVRQLGLLRLDEALADVLLELVLEDVAEADRGLEDACGRPVVDLRVVEYLGDVLHELGERGVPLLENLGLCGA